MPRTESLEDTVQWGDPPCLPQPSLAKELGGADRAGSMCDKRPSWGESSVSGPELEQSQGATHFVSKWSAKGCPHLPVPTGDQEEQEGHPQRSWVLGDSMAQAGLPWENPVKFKKRLMSPAGEEGGGGRAGGSDTSWIHKS